MLIINLVKKLFFLIQGILSYFFGSSKGSADKTESLNKAAEELARNSVIKTTEETIIKTN